MVSNTSDKDANNYNGLIHSDGCGVPSIKNPKKLLAAHTAGKLTLKSLGQRQRVG